MIVPHQHRVTSVQRTAVKPHKPACLWFTGLSGSGKSTIANAVEFQLNRVYKAHTYLLDGDNIRSGLNHDLGFSLEDRTENIRRSGEVAKLFVDAGLIVLTAFISPLRSDRQSARLLMPSGTFFEIYVECPLEICEQRDSKGLYQKARRGELLEFTGISSPYEPPLAPEIILHSGQDSIETCTMQVIDTLKASGILP